MRSLVSYDDIAAPQRDTSTQLGPPLPSTTQPPAKKRRTSYQKAPQKRAVQQHWDEPSKNANAIDYGDHGAGADEMEYDEEEESRELTREEIWDDSALIEAWNSATAEYEAYHGKDQKWKTEPVKKSPLWYNVPPENGKGSVAASMDAPPEDNSAPIDFETYVPTHDPSLAAAAQAALPVGPESDYAQFYSSNGSNTTVEQDEAFTRALSATYWAGYWTAVYHCKRNRQGDMMPGTGEEQADGVESDDDAQDSPTDLLSTQR